MFIKQLIRRGSAFARDDSGGIPLMFSFLMMALALMTGSAVDYSRAMNAKTALSHALDAAALAGANKLVRDNGTSLEVEKAVEATLRASIMNVEADGGKLKTFSVTQDNSLGKVQVAATISMPTTFMQLAGFETVDVKYKAAAQLSDKDIELAMMLDLTGSMGGSKIIDLKSAAKDLVDVLLPSSGNKYKNKIRIGLVPYSQGVNLGQYASVATNNASNNCATERRGAEQFTDASYATMPIGNGSTYCLSSKIFPLSDSNSALKSQINGFSTGGFTAGHTGIGWAWYMLSPNWKGLWPSASDPVDYGTKDTVKIAILMTDGEFNTAYDYKRVYNRRTGTYSYRYVESKGDARTASEYRAKELCKKMKAKGIEIYSVTFQLNSSSAKQMMEDCASKPGNYYDAANGIALRNAFKNIADEISELRISE